MDMTITKPDAPSPLNRAAAALRQPDAGLLILRLAFGGLMLFHGLAKVKDGFAGVKGIGNLLASKGLPEFMAWGAVVGEVIAPVLIVLGLFTRPAAAMLAVNMIVAVGLVHANDIFKLDPKTGGSAIELALFYFLGGVALIFTGGGRYAVRGGRGLLD